MSKFTELYDSNLMTEITKMFQKTVCKNCKAVQCKPDIRTEWVAGSFVMLCKNIFTKTPRQS